MLPAKEVGGDFYDFFLVDDDHLALVIADVSGKGVPEATAKNGELFGTERMVQALNEKGDAAPYELLPHVKTRVDEFVGDAPQFDDLTMLGIKWLGTAHR